MIELTEQQRQAIRHEDPPRVVDPETNKSYVLVPSEVYDRMRQILGDTVYTSAEMLDRTMADDDAADPYLAELQKRYADKL